MAANNIGLAGPNPSVGCIVVRGGEVVGHGWHEYDRMDHAEVMAMRMAAGNAAGSTVYVTLEPCCHQGRTPPCADLLIRKKVGRVVVARIDPNPKVSGGGIARMRSSGIRVDVGLMADAAGRIIEAYACHMATGLPLVVSKAGMSLDGKIGTGREEGRRITSSQGLEYGQVLRLRADALLVGIGTLLLDDPELTYRGRHPRRKPLQRVVLDSRLRTPPQARIFRSVETSPVLIFCREGNAARRHRKLEALGAEIVVVPNTGDMLDLHSVLKELGRREVQGLLVEGGSRVHWGFIATSLVDRFDFILAPMVLGGDGAISCVGGNGFAATVDAPRFRIRRRFSVGPDMVLEGYPSYSRSIISPWLPR